MRLRPLLALLLVSAARADTYETKWLTVVQLYQAYADQPMSAASAEQLATHDPGEETRAGNVNPVTNRSISLPRVQVASVQKTGADYLKLNLSVSPQGYDPKRGEMGTGLTSGNELVLGKALYSFSLNGAPSYSTIHVLIDANDLMSVPISENLFRQMALTGQANAVVAALVTGGGVERRSVSASYYENQNEFRGLPDTNAGAFYVYLIKVRPVSIQITTAAGTLSYSSDQVPTASGSVVFPPDQRLDWLNELKTPLGPPVRAKKSPSLLEARQLGEMLLDAAKAGDVATVTQALQEGAYPLTIDQVNGGNVLTWAITGMEQKKVPLTQQLEVIELLLRFHVDPDGTPDRLPLGMVRDGRAAILLVRAGADPNKKYSSGETLLMRMAASGNLDVVRVLLAAGADASATIARIGAGAVRIQQSAENIADAAGQKAIVRLLRDFSQNGKASLVWSPDTATSGEASATQSPASFTPTGQTPPLLRGFPPSNSP